MSNTSSLPVAGTHFISLETAASLTETYRANREAMLDESYQGKSVLPLSETFNLDDVNDLTSQSGCAGIRIYYGMKQDDTVHAVLVAVNENNEDIIFQAENSIMSTENIILEEGQRCPVICPPASPLNE